MTNYYVCDLKYLFNIIDRIKSQDMILQRPRVKRIPRKILKASHLTWFAFPLLYFVASKFKYF